MLVDCRELRLSHNDKILLIQEVEKEETDKNFFLGVKGQGMGDNVMT